MEDFCYGTGCKSLCDAWCPSTFPGTYHQTYIWGCTTDPNWENGFEFYCADIECLQGDCNGWTDVADSCYDNLNPGEGLMCQGLDGWNCKNQWYDYEVDPDSYGECDCWCMGGINWPHSPIGGQ